MPGLNSMLSFASAAFDHSGQLLDTFTANLFTLPNTKPHPVTELWWRNFPEAWAKCRSNLQSAETAMPAYVAWVKALPGKPVFVGYPASFDFVFIYYYLKRFANENPLGFNVLDIKTYAMALLKTPYREIMKNNLPSRWIPTHPHTHVALDDAIEQGQLFF